MGTVGTRGDGDAPLSPPPRASSRAPGDGHRAALRLRVRDDLFPAARPATGPWLHPGVVGGWALALLLLGAVRQVGVSPFDTVWAEDGSVFLDQALEEGPLRTVPQAYAGYLHLLPRVLSELAAAVPVARSATALAVSAGMVTVLCAVAVLLATGGHVRSVPLRYLLASLVVLQPVAAIESLHAVALLQFHLLVATFWLALWRPQSPRLALAAAATVVLAVLTTPLTLVLAPVYVLRLLLVDTWRDRAVPLAAAAAGAVQLWAVATQPAPGSPGGALPALVELYAVRVAGPAVFGLDVGGAIYAWSPGLLAVLAVVVVAVVLSPGLRPTARHPLTVLLAVGVSVALFLSSVWTRGIALSMVPPSDGAVPLSGSRYVVVPVLLLLAALVLVLDDGPPGWLPAAAWTAGRIGVLGLVGLVVLADFRLVTDRGAGPPWSVEVTNAVVACRAGASEVVLQASPAANPDFRLGVPCTDLPR